LGLAAASVSVAVLPLLSRHHAELDVAAFRLTLSRAIVASLGVCVPAAMVLNIGAEPLIRLVFEHGRFTERDTAQLAMVLSPLAVGLPAAALVLILTRACFARHDSITPAMIFLGVLPVFVIVCPLLAARMQAAGLAVALAAAAWTQAMLLSGLWLWKERRNQHGAALKAPQRE
jgi:putative peptidoglycan lipid II flippase